jgi:hypothetical protein
MNENVLDCSLTHILNNAKKQFEIFHIVLTHSTSRIPSDIAAALPGHVMVLDPANIDCIPELLISTIQLVNGGKAEEIVKQWEDLKQNTILSSLEMLHIPTGGKLQF